MDIVHLFIATCFHQYTSYYIPGTYYYVRHIPVHKRVRLCQIVSDCETKMTYSDKFWVKASVKVKDIRFITTHQALLHTAAHVPPYNE